MGKRSPSINHITISGNIVKDVEVREVGANKAHVCQVMMANNMHFKDKEGNWQETSSFITIEAWGGMAERLGEHGKKGDPILIEGVLKEEKWTDKENKNHSKMKIRAEKLFFL